MLRYFCFMNTFIFPLENTLRSKSSTGLLQPSRSITDLPTEVLEKNLMSYLPCFDVQSIGMTGNQRLKDISDSVIQRRRKLFLYLGLLNYNSKFLYAQYHELKINAISFYSFKTSSSLLQIVTPWKYLPTLFIID